MVKPFPSKTHIGNHMLHPETLMLNYGYDPQLSQGAVKPPVFLTSTFVFKTAEDGQVCVPKPKPGRSDDEVRRGWRVI
jgi:methionine-gamma-lyase